MADRASAPTPRAGDKTNGPILAGQVSLEGAAEAAGAGVGRAGSTERVRVVAQIDRYRGARTEPQWRSAKRFLVGRDPDLRTVRSEQVADLGQVNMADANTLIDFVTWAIKTYPSDKYVLVMSDHGMGWPGGWSDPAVRTGAITNRGVPLASSMGDLMYLNDIDKALATIRSRSGIHKFELVGMDACLMSQIKSSIRSLRTHAMQSSRKRQNRRSAGLIPGSWTR